MVLTQRSYEKAGCRCRETFPYHYGSYATNATLNGKYLYLMFPYHYGSYATHVIREPEVLWRLMFPYHYGSYATRKICADRECSHVSIPLWFLRNAGECIYLPK